MTSCIDPADTSVVEKQPLHENQEKTTQDPVQPTDHEQVAMSLLENNEDNKPISAVPTYAIETAYQNTIENPYKETTVTLPHLVKKVPQDELLPRPWRTFNQVLCLSYFSVIWCLFIGMLANRYAWRAKLQNSKGLYGLAQKSSRIAVYISYASMIIGALNITLIVLSVTVGF